MMVALGEVSSARQGEEVAPGTRDTLQKLKAETKQSAPPPPPQDQ